MNLEHKTLALDSKAGDDGTVELYAAVFGNVDRQGEVIAPGAFSNLAEFVKSGWLALNHEWDDLPLASIEAATQDVKGLRIVARWHNTDDAQACRLVVKERLDRGKAVKCSIGFRTTKDRWDDADGRRVRVLEEIELYEAVDCQPARQPARRGHGLQVARPDLRGLRRTQGRPHPIRTQPGPAGQVP
jgi:HK97 family phage prohead protease